MSSSNVCTTHCNLLSSWFLMGCFFCSLSSPLLNCRIRVFCWITWQYPDYCEVDRISLEQTVNSNRKRWSIQTFLVDLTSSELQRKSINITSSLKKSHLVFETEKRVHTVILPLSQGQAPSLWDLSESENHWSHCHTAPSGTHKNMSDHPELLRQPSTWLH